MKIDAILPRRSGAAPAGFTLLEMVIVLVIIILLLGVSVMSLRGIEDQQTMRTPALELQRMAREAVRRAGMYEETQVIAFEKNAFTIRYKSDAKAVADADRHAVWQRRVDIPPAMRMSIQRWGKTDWIPSAGQRWVVQPSGLCEPLAVRFEMGNSVIALRFNPLTGGVAEETMNIATK